MTRVLAYGGAIVEHDCVQVQAIGGIDIAGQLNGDDRIDAKILKDRLRSHGGFAHVEQAGKHGADSLLNRRGIGCCRRL